MMTLPPPAAVDVRDMLCAQALALVARSAKQLSAGRALVIRYNAADVKRDLLVWARDRGHRIEAAGAETLRLTR